jgi:hypothetical protein
MEKLSTRSLVGEITYMITTSFEEPFYINSIVVTFTEKIFMQRIIIEATIRDRYNGHNTDLMLILVYFYRHVQVCTLCEFWYMGTF